MTNNVFLIVFLFLFLADSVLHLAACWMQNEKLQSLSKPLLMLLLSTVVILKAGGRAGAYIAIPLTFGMIGDILLLKPEGKRFLLGAGSFLVEHLLWIFIYIKAGAFAAVPMWFIAAGSAVYVAALVILFIAIGKPKGAMGAGILLYGAILCALHFTSIAVFFQRQRPGFHLAFPLFLAGSSLFLLSDCLLGYSLCKSRFPKSDFFVMLTYIAAQLLIAWATLCLGVGI